MNIPFFIARRLSLKSGERKNAPAVSVAITAVALSIAVMLAAVAIVFGFKREIRDKVIGFNAHATIYSAAEESGDNIITLIPSLKNFLDNTPSIAEYSLEMAVPSILKTPDNFKGIYLHGLEGTGIRRFISRNLEEGNIPDFSNDSTDNKIVISRLAANQLNLNVGDKIDTYFFTDDIRVRRLTVAGIYNSHFDNYDDVNVYGSLSMLQKLAGISRNQGTMMQIYMKDFNNLAEDAGTLQRNLNSATDDGYLFRQYIVDNALRQGAGYFRWLELLDMNVVVVLVLMIFVACVTLISGMLMIILDKRPLIGMLRTLGMKRKSVRNVFIWLAVKVAIIGILIGNGIMLSLLFIQSKWHIIPLDPNAYYINFVPVEFRWNAFLLLNIGVILLIWLSLIIPSAFASKIAPTETFTTE